MKSHVKETYIELPLKVFTKVFPQYAPDYKKMKKMGINFDDPLYIARMQTTKDGTHIEIGYADDAEWRIGKKGTKTGNSIIYGFSTTEYKSLSPENKKTYINEAKQFVEDMRKTMPAAEITFDEDTGLITVKQE